MMSLKVKMFGDFTISDGKNSISNTANRSKKVWSLIAYLVYHRERIVKQKELIELIWGDEDKGVNPSGALKTLLYRARAELDYLWSGAGKQLIICSHNGYMWNPECRVEIDCDTFERVISDADTLELEKVVEALKLYEGDFLDKMSSEFWVIPISAYFHNVFIDCLRNVVPRMIEEKRFDEALAFCRIATNIESYNEEVHCLCMQTYLACGKQKKAIEVYQKLSERLLSELGVIPSEETRALYHEAIKTNNSHTISISTLQEQLKESSEKTGALICEYDFFRVLYYSMARSVMRNGIAVHIALISAVDKDGELSLRKLDRVMPNVENVIRQSLRRGDSAAKCSVSQYVIMLPRANYENSCMVCERIIKSYYKKFTRADALLRYEVCPLEPDDKENYQWIRESSDN